MKEVRKIRAFIWREKYLVKLIEFQPHTDLSKSTKLSDNLVNLYKICDENVKYCSPRILRKKPSKSNTVYITLKEQGESEKN